VPATWLLFWLVLLACQNNYEHATVCAAGHQLTIVSLSLHAAVERPFQLGVAADVALSDITGWTGLALEQLDRIP